MYWIHIVKEIVFYSTSQSNEPLIYNRAFYLRRVVYCFILMRPCVSMRGLSRPLVHLFVCWLVDFYLLLFRSYSRSIRRSSRP